MSVHIFRYRERKVLDVRVHIIGVVGRDRLSPVCEKYLLHRQDRRSDGVRNLVLRDRSQIQIRARAVTLVGHQILAAGSLTKRAFDPVEIAAANVLNLVPAPNHSVRSRIPGKTYGRTEVIQVAWIGSEARVRRIGANEDDLACVRPGTGRHPAVETSSRNTEQRGSTAGKSSR